MPRAKAPSPAQNFWLTARSWSMGGGWVVFEGGGPPGGAGGGWPRAPPPVSVTERLGYEIPAAAHADAYCDVQMSAAVQKPSATTVDWMFALVTATGVRRTDGTSALPLLTVLPLVIDEGTATPKARSYASWAAASASALIAL